MTIALLTFFAADNYGAVLQAYATIRALEQQGHDVQLVNYIIPEPPRSWMKNLLLYPKHLKLERFRKHWFKQLTRPYLTIDELQKDPPKADCYLIGSDQTWNPFISQNMTRGFFLDFGNNKVLRTSYAASFGMSEWEDSNWMAFEDAKRLLEQFDFISVREDSGVSLLRDKFGIKEVTQVVDPVLLFPHYNELTGNMIQGSEMILYKLINSASFYQQARLLGKMMDCPIRSIGSIRRIKGVHCAYPESLEGWMRRIASARYVITDSFHGTVISLLYSRQFVVCVGDPKRITRIQSLLAQLGHEDRILLDTDSVEKISECLSTPIDYDVVHKKLQSLREGSFEYLKRLSEIKK
jgi:hypothetical protein